jgi:DNA invertase Pin-like site-specific DNA recombinase
MLWQFSQGRRAVIYVRVSTSSQTVENQIAELHEVAMRNGWHVALELTDSGTSGSEGRDQRPAFNELIQRATRREFDVVMVWAIDRLGRSIQQLVDFMNELQWLGIDLYSHQQAINTATPAGRMVFNIFSALGEYERGLIRERILAGHRAQSHVHQQTLPGSWSAEHRLRSMYLVSKPRLPG